uniref:Uncharacterized protein n=1 Tax=Arundo donax TaxID=35708 RepID=A0A0A9H5A9_ARUDO
MHHLTSLATYYLGSGTKQYYLQEPLQMTSQGTHQYKISLSYSILQ